MFTENSFAADNKEFVHVLCRREPHRRHRVLAVVDANVKRAWPSMLADIREYARHHSRHIEMAGEPLILPGGELAKTSSEAVGQIYQQCDALGMDRQSCVLLVGGGAFLDVAGYAAASVHRGLRVVRMPTTVLAQADSGVGVKNGLNLFGKKNFLGSFAPPFAVLCDFRFLETLDRRNTISGMAEAVKVALIRDSSFFQWIERNAKELSAHKTKPLHELIVRSARIHLEHISQSGDAFEMGSARPLDFGHWAAHRLESLTQGRLRHGEAVAIGIALDTVYSQLAGLCTSDVVARVFRVFETLGLSLWDDALQDESQILEGLGQFREHLGGELTITLLTDVGRSVDVNQVSEPLVHEAIDRLRQRARVICG